jgi:hypothetical protein
LIFSVNIYVARGYEYPGLSSKVFKAPLIFVAELLAANKMLNTVI